MAAWSATFPNHRTVHRYYGVMHHEQRTTQTRKHGAQVGAVSAGRAARGSWKGDNQYEGQAAATCADEGLDLHAGRRDEEQVGAGLMASNGSLAARAGRAAPAVSPAPALALATSAAREAGDAPPDDTRAIPTRDVPKWVQLLLWGKAAGRCQ